MITKTLRYASLGLIFLTAFIPLYVNNNLFFPFITGKAFAFRILVEIIFALWLLLVIRDKKYAPKFSKISLALTVFTVVIFITDMFGLNPLRSIWSNFERMEGWVMIVHLWGYFIATTAIFGSGEEGRRMWHTFFNVSIVAAACVGFWGFLQIFGVAEIHQGSSRIDASLGNAAYMAVYMLIHAFIALYMSLVSREKKNIGAAWWYIILGIIFSYLLFETSTRGTILGLVGGIMLALGIFAVFGKGENKKSRIFSGVGIAVFVLLGVLLVVNKDASFIKKHETLNRLASISLNSEGQARQYIWPMAVKGIFETPKTAILGVGQENFNYIFNSHYNPKMWGQEQWFDRAHNVFLDWLVAGGLVGFILYISLFVLAVMALWKSTLGFKEKALLTGTFVGYAIHNIFVFDNIASYILFITMLGFVHSVTADKPIKLLERNDSQSENMIVVRDYVLFPLIAILFVATLYCVNIRVIQANQRLISAMIMCSGGAGRIPSADLFAKALKLNQSTANQEIREQLLSCSSNVIAAQVANDLKQSFYTLASEEVQKQIKTTPLDARVYDIGGIFFNNISDWKTGLELLEKANELSPNKQSIIFDLSVNYMNSGQVKKALTLLEAAYKSAPENDNAKVAYISALILDGQEKKARAEFGNDSPLFSDPRVINVYTKLKEYGKVIENHKSLIKKDPTNIQNYASLAAAYLQSGDKQEALAELRLMIELFPAAKDQIVAAIAQVEGTGK